MQALTPATLKRAAHAAGLAAVARRFAGIEPGTLPAAMRRLEEISLRAIMELLAATSALRPDAAKARTEREILAGLGAAPRHAWLVRRWLAALYEDGLIDASDNGYRWRRIPPAAGAADDLAAAYAALGFPPAMSRAHRSVLDRLDRLVRDEIQIAELLFYDGQVLAALAAYQDNIFTAYLNAACASLVRTQAAVRDARRLRILELGGGAGLTTQATLEALEGIPADYLFTDVSRVFTLAAKTRYAGRDGLRVGLFDLDVDPAAQGLGPKAADLVLAGNVLHNAIDLRRTLAGIRALLAPGGVLIFIESTQDNRAMLTAMQFLLSPAPGARARGSGDRRAASGEIFMGQAAWDEELAAAGLKPLLHLPDPLSPLAAAGQGLFYCAARDDGTAR